MHIKRSLEMTLPAGQSCFLWGARKTGKSTYLRERFPEATWIDLLQADTYQKYLLHPYRLREELLKQPTDQRVIIDEVQKVPALLDEIHGLIEQGYQFILCGSSARKLKATGANLLGGRAWRYHFLPLCYNELQTIDWPKIFNHGLIPSHYLSDHPDKERAAYLYDYVMNEVQYEAQLRKRESFARFLEILGTSNSEMIAFSNIARDCGVDSKTVRTYFEILEDMYLGYFCHPFQERSKRQSVQAKPKFYLFDTGLACYLKQYQFQSMMGSDAGKAFEHYVFLELMAYKLMFEKRANIGYWRLKNGDEVDFIFENQACGVKMSDQIHTKHLKGLLSFSDDHPEHTLHVISLEKTQRLLQHHGCEIHIWPIETFLKALWQHQIWASA